MNQVTVTASGTYEVQIGAGILEHIGTEARKVLRAETVFLISDSNVFPIYGQRVADSLKTAGFKVDWIVCTAGERAKSPAMWVRLMEHLAHKQLTRSDAIIALGGGVMGDLAGFCAATYLRGIDYIQVPTSLLAMVDSSVGGKTAIDLTAGKNLCGAFKQPKLVLCDTECLKTLPRKELLCGCAEVIKYGVLGDAALFETLKAGPDRQDWPAIITRCVEMKRDIVEQDEFDKGLRQSLNLGHTLGHAIEKIENFSLSHGQCVAIGMAMIARSAVKFGLCDADTRDQIVEILNAYGLPTETDKTADWIVPAALGDKKRQGSTLTLVIPRQIGRCELHKIDITDLEKWV